MVVGESRIIGVSLGHVDADDIAPAIEDEKIVAKQSSIVRRPLALMAMLADQIVVLLDGAVTEAYIKGVADAMTAAKGAALTLLAHTA